MKIALCLVSALLLIGLLCADEIAYDISKFHPTDILSYSLSAGYSNDSGYNFTKADYAIYNLSNNLSLNGEIYKQRRNYLWSLSSYDSGVITKSHNVQYYDKADTKTDRFNTGYSTNKEASYTHYWGNLFIGGTAYTSINLAHNEYESQQDTLKSTDNSNSTYWNTTFSGSFGLGRLYECQEAYTAWYIYRDLDKNNCLSRQYTATDIDSLAYKLFELRTLYGIDPDMLDRKKTTLLLEYFKSTHNLIPETEPKAYAILLQLWKSSYTQRLVGTKIEIIPAINLANYKQTHHYDYDEQHHHSDTKNYNAIQGVELFINYERPIHNVYQLRGQFYAVQNWIEGFSRPETHDSTYTNLAPYTHLDASGIFAWYPDYRSELALNINANFKYKYFNDSDPTLRNAPLNPKPNPKPKDNVSESLPKEQRFELDVSLSYKRNLTNRTTARATLSYQQSHYRGSGYPVTQTKDVSLYAYLNYRLF